MSAQFRKVDEVVLHSGYIFDLVRAEFEAPGGESFSRDIVRHPGASVLLPLLSRAPSGRDSDVTRGGGGTGVLGS